MCYQSICYHYLMLLRFSVISFNAQIAELKPDEKLTMCFISHAPSPNSARVTPSLRIE